MLTSSLHYRSSKRSLMEYLCSGRQASELKLIIGAKQQGFLIVPGAHAAVIAGYGRCGDPLLQGGLLGVLLVGWGEIVDGILNHVSRVHGLL